MKQKLNEWNDLKKRKRKALNKANKQKIEREIGSIDEVFEVLNVIDLNVAITGTLSILPRKEFKLMLENKGASVVKSVNKKTAYLFMGDTGRYEVTNKMKKAHEFGVKIVIL